jgi:hypothetical protein
MAIPSVSRLPPRMAACCTSALRRTFRPQGTALLIVPAQTRPPEPHYSALSFEFDTLALGMDLGSLCFSWEYGAVTKHTLPVTEIMLWEGACIRKQCILSGGQCVPPSCCRYNSRSCARRSGPSSANASWTTGLFNSGFVSKSELIHTAGSTQTKTVTSM